MGLLALAAPGLAAFLSVAPLAQTANGGARSVALAGAGVAMEGDPLAEANPAAWATVRNAAAGLTASQPYGMRELRTVAAGAVLPTPAVTVGVAVRAIGFDDYREIRASLGGARSLRLAAGRQVAIGIRADYHSVTTTGFPTHNALDLAVGLQADVTPAAAAGIAVQNVRSIARPDSTELRTPHSLSPTLAVGAALRPAESTTLALAVEKDVDFPPLVRAGLEFTPIRPATLRLGAAVPLAGGGAARLAFGAGFDVAHLAVDAAVDWHLLLGPTPAVSVSARF